MPSGDPPMRRAGGPAHRGVVRQYLVNIGRDDDDRVCGTVVRNGQVPARFSGWLELLGLLEGDAEAVDTMEKGADR